MVVVSFQHFLLVLQCSHGSEARIHLLRSGSSLRHLRCGFLGALATALCLLLFGLSAQMAGVRYDVNGCWHPSRSQSAVGVLPCWRTLAIPLFCLSATLLACGSASSNQKHFGSHDTYKDVRTQVSKPTSNTRDVRTFTRRRCADALS